VCLSLLIWIVVSSDCNDEVDEHAECTFEVVGFAVTEKIPDGEDREDEEDDLEDGKVEVLRCVSLDLLGPGTRKADHILRKSPAYDDH